VEVAGLFRKNNEQMKPTKKQKMEQTCYEIKDMSFHNQVMFGKVQTLT
jgi:hypothetical protein